MSKEKSQEKINDQLSQNGAGKSRTAIIIVAILIVCILAGVILYLVFGKEPAPDADGNRVVTPDNVEEMLAQLDDSSKSSAGSYEATMNAEWEFDNGTAVSKNAYVANSVNNTNTVYFTVTRSDNGEEILKSPDIPVGSSLTDIKLDKDLDAGVYSTVLTYHLVDDDHEELSTASFAVTITVKN